MIESILGAVVQTIKPLNKGVPGVPLHSLDAIADENTRQVLRAIVDGWHMRNGASGDGDNRFVTSSELNAVVGRVGGLAQQLSQAQSLLSGIDALSPGNISRVINDLQTQVFESKLFKDLGERVNLIDKPGGIFDRLGAAETTIINEREARIEGDAGLARSLSVLGLRIGNAETIIAEETSQRIEGDTALTNSVSVIGTRVANAEAGLVTETQQRVNADNALQTTITTQFASVNNSLSLAQTSITTNANNVTALTTRVDQVQASVGSLSAAVSAETTARVNADNTLFAQYTLRVDVAGRVSGFGLASSQASSEFIVRSDRFAIGSPSGNSISPAIPFTVLTTPQSFNGKIRPPGVYISDAFLGNGVIDNAKIGNAAIDTLQLAGEAVLVPVFAEGFLFTTVTSSWSDDIASGWMSVDGLASSDRARVAVTAALQAYPTDASAANLEFGIFVNNTLNTSATSTLQDFGISITNMGSFLVPNGGYNVSVRVRCAPGAASAKDVSMLGRFIALAAKR